MGPGRKRTENEEQQLDERKGPLAFGKNRVSQRPKICWGEASPRNARAQPNCENCMQNYE
jgi:hypothetical protein